MYRYTHLPSIVPVQLYLGNLRVSENMKTVSSSLQLIQNHISAIREEHNIDIRIMMLHELNNLLPVDKRMEFPSLITNAYIRGALDVIQDRAMTQVAYS
jgi:hypothetical protein